jgi:hypothetical protein
MVQGLRRRARRSPTVLKRAVAGVAALRAVRLEPRLLNAFDRVATFSEKDASLLVQLGVRVPISVEQLYFDLPPRAAAPSGSNVLLTGAMYRAENDQAAQWFLTHIWPQVKRQVPSTVLTIAGSGPSADLQRLAKQSRDVQVTGYVDDLTAVYGRASVAIAPLLMGAGVKVKVIEALASGLPVVATTIGAEGLPENLFGGIADDPTVFGQHVTDLLRDPAARSKFGAAGRAWAEEAHARIDENIGASVELYRRAADALS